MGWQSHRYGHMVQEYYVARVRKIFEERRKERAAIRTRREALKLQERLRRDFAAIFGPWPARTPLRPRMTGVVEARGYRIEKLLIESRPSFLVSANLYIPSGLRAPAPAVLAACGHTNEGKAAGTYQTFVQGLVQKGFVVLIYDPIGQGERIQYPDREGRSALGLCAEHNMLGGQQILLGDWFGSWRTWDGIRCLDYLLTRPEVDPARVGMTGNSGGGTLTGWVSANEDRLCMSAPGSWVTSIRSNVENELSCDIEQMPPGFLERGLDHSDCFLVHAPRPVIVLSQQRDFFDVRGARAAFLELQRMYRLLGAADHVRHFIGPQTHGYGKPLREAMYGFFLRHAGQQGSAREPRILVRSEAELQAAPGGSVANAGSRRVLEFTRERADALREKRKRLGPEQVAKEVGRLLAVPVRQGVPAYRILRPAVVKDELWHGYAVETEPGIQAVVTMVCPDRQEQFAVPAEKACTLLVPHTDAAEDLGNRRIRGMLRGGGRLFAVDPRGIGQSMSRACSGSDFFNPYDCDYHFNSLGQMLQEPYQGRRVFDVLRTLDWLYSCGYRDVCLFGRGLGALTALFAGLLEPRVRRITLAHVPPSYDALTRPPVQQWPHSALVFGFLKTLDLPDCHRALGARLRVIAPWNARMKTGA
jgi:hypothetical protein